MHEGKKGRGLAEPRPNGQGVGRRNDKPQLILKLSRQSILVNMQFDIMIKTSQ